MSICFIETTVTISTIEHVSESIHSIHSEKRLKKNKWFTFETLSVKIWNSVCQYICECTWIDELDNCDSFFPMRFFVLSCVYLVETRSLLKDLNRNTIPYTKEVRRKVFSFQAEQTEVLRWLSNSDNIIQGEYLSILKTNTKHKSIMRFAIQYAIRTKTKEYIKSQIFTKR